MSKEPKEVAEGAVDRLCDYNAIEEDPMGFFEQTADNVSEFLYHFIYLTALRLNEASRNEMMKGKIKEMDEVIEEVKQSLKKR